ncbi:MAG: phosphoribosylformylglycinamidine cyclo-ligase, partial [Victivallaceae bacterium]|nr:phosphoribosylformylglycinamidine cyclo-ligase [Victivallaceae bacterium]
KLEMSGQAKSDLYKAAGVDIDLATDLLDRVKGELASTRRPEMLAPIGGFGGRFSVDTSKYRNPVLVSSIDGVGTKLMVAAMMNKYDTVGCDIVNHCINDISVQGAEPVYFMDYIGIGKLRSPLYENVLSGIARACRESGCAVLGGETAEMPGMYGNDFDLVGVITGIVERDEIITGENIRPGHVAVGLGSNGLHTNGFSLARRILFDKAGFNVADRPSELGGESVGEALLKPHTCYYNAITAARKAGVSMDGIAHITGGGLYDNVPRILPQDVDVEFDVTGFPVPPICRLIVDRGEVGFEECYRVFNMGVGMVWFVPAADADKAIAAASGCGLYAARIGSVVSGARRVRVSCAK